METSSRVMALGVYYFRLPRMAAIQAAPVALCIGVLGSIVVLLTDYAVLLPIVFAFAFGGFALPFVKARGKMWREVVRFISTNNAHVEGFENKTMSYLGYTVRVISNRASIIDGDVLMYVKSSIGVDDVRDATNMASERRVKSVVMVLRWFGASRVSRDAKSLMEKHGVGMLDLNSLFGACHAKMAADWRRDADAA